MRTVLFAMPQFFLQQWNITFSKQRLKPASIWVNLIQACMKLQFARRQEASTMKIFVAYPYNSSKRSAWQIWQFLLGSISKCEVSQLSSIRCTSYQDVRLSLHLDISHAHNVQVKRQANWCLEIGDALFIYAEKASNLQNYCNKRLAFLVTDFAERLIVSCSWLPSSLHGGL